MTTENPYDQFGFLTDDFFGNRYSFYKWLQEQDPVHWCEPANAWMVTRFDDVVVGLTSHEFSSERYAEGEARARFLSEHGLDDLLGFYRGWLMFMGRERHSRIRRFVQRAIQDHVAAMTVEALRRTADLVLDSCGVTFDMVRQFAMPYSVDVIADFIGVEEDARADVRHWSEAAVAFLGVPAPSPELGLRAQDGFRSLRSYIRHLFSRATNGGDRDLVARLAAVLRAHTHPGVSEEDALLACANVLVDGHEPVANAIANGVLDLVANPGAYEHARTRLDVVGETVEESLRLSSPFQYCARIALNDVLIGGRRIAAGQKVLFVIGAANREAERVVDPDRFDVSRPDCHHLAFGFGPHYCLGAELSRLMLRAAFGALISRYRAIRCVDRDLRWVRSLGYLAPTALEIWAVPG